jgi:hypothetical protein
LMIRTVGCIEIPGRVLIHGLANDVQRFGHRYDLQSVHLPSPLDWPVTLL